MQDCTAEFQLITLQNCQTLAQDSKSIQKYPKVSKSIQKYPKVSKSIQKYPKVSEFANHSVPEHIGRASSRLGLASEHELSLSSQDQLEISLINLIILMPNLEALHGSAHSQPPDTSIQRTAHASSRRMLLQPLWKVQPLPWKLGNKHHVLTTKCRRHWLKEKSESKRTLNTLIIRSWKSIWCKIAQQSFNSSHNKTVKHWLKTPKVSKSIQKYPKVSKSIQKYLKVSKSIQKCQSLPITVSPNTLAEPPPDWVWHRSTSYPWPVKISWR